MYTEAALKALYPGALAFDATRTSLRHPPFPVFVQEVHRNGTKVRATVQKIGKAGLEGQPYLIDAWYLMAYPVGLAALKNRAVNARKRAEKAGEWGASMQAMYEWCCDLHPGC